MAPKENIAISLLSRAHSPDSTTRIFTEKVKTRPLYLKPADHDHDHDNAQHQRRRDRERKKAARKKKLKPKPLSSRERRALCLYEIPPSARKYSIYAPLHRMWVAYIQEVLEGAGFVSAGTAAKLCSADYHGAEVEVVRSRCVSRVGVRGIVVRDTKFTFEVVTVGDQVKVVPKEHTIFRFTVPRGRAEGEETLKEGEGKVVERDFVFELHGDQFIFRAADRAMKKFKPKFNPDL